VRNLAPDIVHIGSKEIEIKPGSQLTETPTEPALAQMSQRLHESPVPPAQGGKVKPVSADRFSVNFTADSEFRQLLEEVRALISHAEPKGELLNVMKRGLEALRGELMKKRFGVGRKLRRVRLSASEPRAASVGSKQTRHVAAAVAREVYARDQGRLHLLR
jgi:hypothetical protein